VTNTLGTGLVVGAARVEKYFRPAYWFPIPRISVLHDWRAQFSPEKTIWSIAQALSGVATPCQSEPGNNVGGRVFQFLKTANSQTAA